MERSIKHGVFLKTMDCSNAELRLLPLKTPSSVNKIILSNNKINAVQNKMFNSLDGLIVLFRIEIVVLGD